MIKAREIKEHLRDAESHGLNLYWMKLGCNGRAQRVINVRGRKGIVVQVRTITSDDWQDVTNGDAFYIQ